MNAQKFGIATVDIDGTPSPVVVTERGTALLNSLLGSEAPLSVRALLTSDWDGWCDRIAVVLEQDIALKWQPSDNLTFLAPLPDPANLYMAGANYYDHVREM